MGIGELGDNWDDHRESVLFVRFQYGEEEVVFEEAHGAVRNL